MSNQNTKIFVCDLGFSSLKWLYNNRQGRISSAFQRQASGMVYGEEALIFAGSSCLKTTKDLVAFYPGFVKHALKKAVVIGDNMILVLGLPYQFWQQEMAKKAVGEPNSISELETACSSDQFSHVMVLPQGLGGIKSHLKETQTQDVNSILGIDIGFNTIIYSLYNVSQHRIIYSDTCYKKGVHQMATQLLLPEIAKLTPSKSYTPVEISGIIEKGHVQYGMDYYDLKEQINSASIAYIGDTMRDIIGDLQGHLGQEASFDQVVFFGGGARLIREVIPSSKVKVSVSFEPEYANVRGFHQIAAEKFRA